MSIKQHTFFEDMPTVEPKDTPNPQYFIYAVKADNTLHMLKRYGHADTVQYELVEHGATRKKPTRWKTLRRANEVLADIADADHWHTLYTFHIGNYLHIESIVERLTDG